jgi:hypothetical protein
MMKKCKLLFLSTVFFVLVPTTSKIGKSATTNVQKVNLICDEKIEPSQVKKNQDKKKPVKKPVKKQVVKTSQKKKKKPVSTFNNFDSYYCKLTTKDLQSNYEIIETNVYKSFEILYDSIPLDSNKFNFLIEITMVESRLGYFTDYFSNGGTRGKGPWQIDRCAFDATKDIYNHPQLIPYLNRIKEKTGIDWRKEVQWEHCNYVFFGAITAHLYLIVRNLEIHESIYARSKQWKVHYNTYMGLGRPQDYLNKVSEVKNKLNI